MPPKLWGKKQQDCGNACRDCVKFCSEYSIVLSAGFVDFFFQLKIDYTIFKHSLDGTIESVILCLNHELCTTSLHAAHLSDL